MADNVASPKTGDRLGIRSRSRCAVYTRKSSEEGLEQGFNSLDAQREACEAYIKSQAHEGWQAISTRYDDGGYSGGTLERPALQRLLTAIKERHIDVVVIYKIDRLSRSLMDFARLAELFDAHRVSFVSVTQAFNTTSSMGRLMLNVLLSFAQFEREITGERIRDKVAASKKKGMWMGGHIPLGYDRRDRALVINEREAIIVKTIYGLYLKHGCVRRVQSEAQHLGFTSRRRELVSGRAVGGIAFGRGHLYRILSNPLYVGRIAHKEESYAGNHPPIVDQTMWDAVQAGLARNTHLHRTRTNHRSPSLLAGLLVDDQGVRFRSTQTTKGGRQHRYYTHAAIVTGVARGELPFRHVPAKELERVVLDRLDGFLRSPSEIQEALGDTQSAVDIARISRCTAELGDRIRLASPDIIPTLQQLLDRVVLKSDAVCVLVSLRGLRNLVGLSAPGPGRLEADPYEIVIPARIRAKTGQVRLLFEAPGGAPQPRIDAPLIRTLARAQRWWEQLQSGQAQSVLDIATAEKLSGSLVTRILRLAFLAPDIVEAIIRGEQPPELTSRRLLSRAALPLDWAEQRRALRFPTTP